MSRFLLPLCLLVSLTACSGQGHRPGRDEAGVRAVPPSAPQRSLGAHRPAPSKPSTFEVFHDATLVAGHPRPHAAAHPTMAKAHPSLPPAARPAARNVYWWWKKRNKLLQERLAATKRVDVLFVGDSITHYWEIEGADAWAHAFGSWHPFNFGVGGDQTQHILYRLKHTAFGALRPKVAVVMAGTNNAALRTSPRNIALGIKAIVKTLKEKFPGIKILLVGILPRGDRPTGAGRRALGTNPLLARLHNGKDIFYVDFTSLFKKGHAVIAKLFKHDSLHLSHAGYALWGQLLAPKIRTLLEPRKVLIP